MVHLTLLFNCLLISLSGIEGMVVDSEKERLFYAYKNNIVMLSLREKQETNTHVSIPHLLEPKALAIDGASRLSKYQSNF